MALDSYVFAEVPGGQGADLVFAFHGTGGNENQFTGLARDLLPEAHIIAPRGDVAEGGALRFFRRKAEGVYDMDDLAARTRNMADFVAEQKARLKPRRVIGLGYSNGANILASVMFANGDLFDVAALLHPLIPFAPKPQPALAHKSVLITAGERDPICPPALTRSLQNYFVEQGANVEAVWHSGGHELRPTEIEAVARVVGR